MVVSVFTDGIFAYYESIVRPNINGQRPAPIVQEGNSSVRLDLPNATLEPYEGKNYDVSLEWYNREGSAISIGYFQKDISNLFSNEIGYCPENNSDPLVTELIGEVERVAGSSSDEAACEQVALFTPEDDGTGIPPEPRNRTVTIKNPVNSDDDLKLEGFELAVQQKLDFLPYPWNGFGGVFNYTKLRQSGDAGRLQRVSPESFNFISYWENDGVSLRLSYNWRDDQITAGANSFLGTGVRTIKAKGRLDLSSSYKINSKTKIFFQAFNLTDEVTVSHYGDTDDAIHQLTYNGRIYKASISYKF